MWGGRNMEESNVKFLGICPIEKRHTIWHPVNTMRGVTTVSNTEKFLLPGLPKWTEGAGADTYHT